MTATVDTRPGGGGPLTGRARSRDGRRTPDPRAWTTGTVALAVVIFAMGAVLSFWRLDVATWLSDEPTYVDAGIAYLDGDYADNTAHPFLAKQVIGASVAVFGEDAWAVRLPSALAGVLTGAVLLALARRMRSTATGLAVAAIWLLLPHAPSGSVGRFERYAMLEPLMILFVSAAMYAAWRWGENGRWRWALAAGAAAGLATSSKLPGVLVLPALAVVATWAPGDRRRRVLQLLAMGGAAIVAFLLPYVPAGGDAPDAIRFIVDSQRGRAERGHTVGVAGTNYKHPPWWSSLWWMKGYLGWGSLVALFAGAVASLAVPDRRVRLFVVAALGVGLAADALSPVKLPYYHMAWWPALALSAGVGLSWLAGRRPIGRLAAAAAAVALAVSSIGVFAEILTLEPSGYRAAADLLAAEDLSDAEVLVVGHPHLLGAYLPGLRTFGEPPGDPPAAVVVDRSVTARWLDNPVEPFVEARASEYEAHRFDQVTVYVRRT